MDPSARHGPPPPDDDRGYPGLLVINWILLPICLIVLALRLHTRLFIKKSAGWDDWLMIVAALLAIMYAIIQTIQVHWGYGHHAVYLSMPSLTNLGWSNVFITDVNALCLFFIRSSICAFLFRMITSTLAWVWPIYLAMALNFIVMIGTICLYATMCIPLVGLWNRRIKADCGVLEHATPVIKTLGALNVLVDVLCAVMPVIVIKDLQTDRKSKITLSVILLSCGAVAAACGIGRVAALPTGVAPDPTFDWVSVTYWQAAEQYLSMLFASLPAINQLQNHFSTGGGMRPSKRSAARYDPEQGPSAEVTKASRASKTRSVHGDNGLMSIGMRKTPDTYIELYDVGDEQQVGHSHAADMIPEEPRTPASAARLSAPWTSGPVNAKT